VANLSPQVCITFFTFALHHCVLHKKNKLQALHFFNHIPSNIKAAATVKYPWNKTEVTPTLTSIPPHVTIMDNFEQMLIEMEATKNTILSRVEVELDKRHIGSQSYFASEVQSKMIIMGHQILSCHVPVVRSFFIL
jgi:hypothetical protein